MNTAAQYAWDAMMRALPDPVLARFSGDDLVSPCFHLVTDDGVAPPHVRHLFRCLDAASFEQDLDRLLKGRAPVSLKDLEERATAGRSLPAGAVFVSFDDGMREMYDVVAPLCRRKGVPVTFFLTTAFLDNRALFFRHKASGLIDAIARADAGGRALAAEKIREHFNKQGIGVDDPRTWLLGLRHGCAALLDECAHLLGVDFAAYLQDQRPYLTIEQVRELLKQGFSIGGHSVDHPLFAELSLPEQLRQTRASLDELSETFSTVVRAFAFPFVSTGVKLEYYDAVFEQSIADLLFCIGEMPGHYGNRIVARFGVESRDNASAMNIWRQRVSRRIRGTFSSTVRAGRAG